jgi:predicted RND superfamily exporter protein
MLPNVLPVLVVFGGMGWLGIPIDIGSMMASSIALGVAVDDTIHFLSWYREDLKKLGNRKAAIAAAYGRCGPPTLQAALISGLSLAVFTFSTFTPTQRLGWLMMTILVCGVIAELVMMPAILAGPLGRAIPVGRPPAPPAAVPVPHTTKQRRGAALVTSQT